MATKHKTTKRKLPLRWRKISLPTGWDYHRGGDVLGKVRWSDDKRRWYFCCKDGYSSYGEPDCRGLWIDPEKAKDECQLHVKRYLD